jgi:hypothetical protein
MRWAVLRCGDWLFAVHPFFTVAPRLDRYAEGGVRAFSLWWMWFEVARATVEC